MFSIPCISRRRISIHALREEGDPESMLNKPMSLISIHALREEGDRTRQVLRRGSYTFLSTPSARRATKRKDWATRMELISIHALREEGDSLSTARVRWISISIHALREEGDCVLPSIKTPASHFYPRPPRGGRLLRQALQCNLRGISIHALREEGDNRCQQ